MKILSIGSVNCLTFGKDSTIELEGGVTAIVGPNGSGKTNLVRLIQYVSQILARRSDPFKPSDIISVGEATFRVEVKVMFTEVERQAILDFLLCTLVTETSNWKGDNTITTGDLEELKNNLLLMKSKEIFRDFPHQVTVIIYWEGANNFTPSFGFKLSLDGRDFYLNSMGTFLSVLEERNFGSQSLTFLIVDYLSQHFSNYKGSERGKELVDKLSLEFGERSYEPPTLGDFLKVVGIGPGGVQVGGVVQALTFSYFENKLSTSLSLKPKRDLLLQQEGRFLRFLERRNFRASVVSLTDLISTIFNSSIVTLPSPRNRPPDSIELKTSELVPDRSYSIYTEDIPSSVTIEGDQIPSILFELWTSSDYKSIGSFETIKEEFLKLTGYRITVSVDWRERRKSVSLDRAETMFPDLPISKTISAPEPSQVSYTEYYRVIRLNLLKGDIVFHLDMVPGGIVELLQIFVIIGGSENNVILLDEPGQNLHPSWQEKVVKFIRKSTSRGNQIVLITHSPEMIDPLGGELIERFQLENNKTMLRTISTREIETQRRMVIWTKLVRSLFSSGVILAEGDGEEMVLRIWLQKAGYDLGEKQIQIIDVNGQDHFKWFGKTLRRWGIPYVMFSDSKAANENFVKKNKGLVIYFREDELMKLFINYDKPVYDKASKVFGRKKSPDIAVYFANETEPHPIIGDLISKMNEVFK